MYSLLTCLVLIWVSISLAFDGFLPNINSPEVSLSSLKDVLYSLSVKIFYSIPVNSSEVLEPLLFGKYKDHGVVPVPPTRMDRDRGWLIHHHQVLRHVDDLDPLIWHWDLMSENRGVAKVEDRGFLKSIIMFWWFCFKIYLRLIILWRESWKTIIVAMQSMNIWKTWD